MTNVNIPSPFLSWLHYEECKPGLINSYYYAVLSENFKELFGKGDDDKIPGFNFLEEIDKENNSKYESEKIRDLLIHLLKIALPEKEIECHNYMSELKTFLSSLFLERKKKLLNFNSNFHEGEVKLWILHSLLQFIEKDKRHPKPIGRDSTGNLYFSVNDSCLYVQYGTHLQELTRNPDRITNHDARKFLLDRLSSMPRWKLLADSEAHWTTISMILESFNEIEIAKKIAAELNKESSTEEPEQHKEKAHVNFKEGDFQREIPLRRSRTQLKKPPSLHSEEPSVDSQPRDQRDSSSDVLSQSDRASNAPDQKQNKFRCMYFPNCRRSDADCSFAHPNRICRNFGKGSCPGVFCRFVHPDCPNDGHCTDDQCPYEHRKSLPSLRRILYAKTKEGKVTGTQSSESSREEKEVNRLNANVGDRAVRFSEEFEGKVSISNQAKYGNIEPYLPQKVNEPVRASPIHNERPFSNKELRCHYFPRCNKPADRCMYAHPREHCPSFPNCVRARDCPFLHGPCPDDLRCVNEFCSFEHYQQIPPRAAIAHQRIQMQKRAQQF